MIEDLHEHQRCTEDFRNFLEIIRRDMLVAHQPNPPDQEEPTGVMLLGSIPHSLNVSGQDSPRRKSCGDIYRLLGDIKPRCDQESISTRRSTMEPTSPLAQSHFNWAEPERPTSPTPLHRALPGRRRSSGLGLRKQAALANRSSLPKHPRTYEDEQKGYNQEPTTHSYDRYKYLLEDVEYMDSHVKFITYDREQRRLRGSGVGWADDTRNSQEPQLTCKHQASAQERPTSDGKSNETRPMKNQPNT
jgi:hypothetical protein